MILIIYQSLNNSKTIINQSYFLFLINSKHSLAYYFLLSFLLETTNNYFSRRVKIWVIHNLRYSYFASRSSCYTLSRFQNSAQDVVENEDSFYHYLTLLYKFLIFWLNAVPSNFFHCNWKVNPSWLRLHNRCQRKYWRPY